MNVSGLPPCAIVQGDTYKWTTTVPAYPPSDGWQLGITFRSEDVADTGTLFNSVSGAAGGYDFSLDFDETAVLFAGVNLWSMRAINGVDGRTVAAGRTLVTAGLSSGPIETLTWAERMLAALKAIGPTLMANGYAEMDVDGAKTVFRSLDEYFKALAGIEERVRLEEDARPRCDGKTGNRRRILAVFTPPRI
jgi:hypothetical protein